MKPTLALITFTATLISASPRLAAQTVDGGQINRVMPVRFAEVEMPAAPRARAEAKIIVGGYLPSSCYHDLQTNVESPDPHTHYVRALAKKVINQPCAQDRPEFERQVSLGELSEGEHRLIIQAAGESFAVRQFTVSP